MIFHGRRDLGTIQTYVAHGGRGAGEAVGASELLRVPCDLDLSDAGDRDEAQDLYAEQAARAARRDRRRRHRPGGLARAAARSSPAPWSPTARSTSACRCPPTG